MSVQPGDILRLTVKGAIRLKNTANILHYQCVDGTQLPSEASFANVFDIQVATAFWRHCVTSAFSFTGYTVQVIYPVARQQDPINIDIADYTGTIIQEALPPQSNMLIRHTSALVGRSGRGRTFIVGIPETGQDLGTLTGGQLGLLNGTANALGAGLTVGLLPPVITYTPVHWSQKRYDAGTVPPWFNAGGFIGFSRVCTLRGRAKLNAP